MNAARRKRIAEIAKRIDWLAGELQGIIEQLGEVRDEEVETFEALPESLQGSDRGLAIMEASDTLNDACEELDSIDLDTVIQSLSDLVP